MKSFSITITTATAWSLTIIEINNLFDVLETYAQLYYIYSMETPLVVSNYSTRFDNVLVDAGNFPNGIFAYSKGQAPRARKILNSVIF